jgi:hypothetical protein
VFNPKILTAMKQKLKKIGVLAVLLANVAIFAPQKVEGQKTILIDEMGDGSQGEYKRTDIQMPLGILIIHCGGKGTGCIGTITVNG